MRTLIFLLIIFWGHLFAFETSGKNEVRKLFYYSVESTDSLKKFETELKKLNSKIDENFLLAYNGAYLTLVAKHSINPYTKYYKLKEGLELIGEAIQREPNNLEYRFIRLSILNYVPSFLGFDDLFFEDFEKANQLIRQKDYSIVDKQTQKGIIEFLLRSKKLNSVQKSELKKLYKDFE
ncbi:MAG: hypothetical protein NUV92_04975 [Ignavibacteria bacterium]|jgi:hypothetical protein|nr:hypothetical protein [Ignavibacteria bacterium]MDH7526855.1 hypothetical protein [Ignavibacteria bacterium]